MLKLPSVFDRWEGSNLLLSKSCGTPADHPRHTGVPCRRVENHFFKSWWLHAISRIRENLLWILVTKRGWEEAICWYDLFLNLPKATAVLDGPLAWLTWAHVDMKPSPAQEIHCREWDNIYQLPPCPAYRPCCLQRAPITILKYLNINAVCYIVHKNEKGPYPEYLIEEITVTAEVEDSQIGGRGCRDSMSGGSSCKTRVGRLCWWIGKFLKNLVMDTVRTAALHLEDSRSKSWHFQVRWRKLISETQKIR